MSAQLRALNTPDTADRRPPKTDRFGTPLAEVVDSYQHVVDLKAGAAYAEKRAREIAVRAYYLAEKHSFDPSFDVANWLLAQAEVDSEARR